MIKEKSIYTLKYNTMHDATILWCDTISKNGQIYDIRLLITREIKKQIYWDKMQTSSLDIFMPTIYDNPERLLIEKIFRYNFTQTGE